MTAGPDGSALPLTAAWVATQMGGTLASGNPSREFGDVSIDSRTLKAGDLFVAIRGERYNGALFAAGAIESGAAGVVVPRGWYQITDNRRASDRSASLSDEPRGEPSVWGELRVDFGGEEQPTVAEGVSRSDDGYRAGECAAG